MTTPQMSEDLFALYDLPAALNIAAFEPVSKERFRPIGRLPAWWARLEPPDEAGAGFDLEDRFPILGLFLPECASVWENGTRSRLKSDLWTEHDAEGGRWYLRAVATRAGKRCLLVIALEPQELFTYQQLAHDFEMEKEKVERISSQLEIRRQEAERATRAKSDFLAVMSHEIRTPLNAIIGMSDLLSASPLTPEQQKYVEVFQRNGISLLNLINDILDLAKVESGKIELESVDMDLREVIARAMEVVEGRARAKGLELTSSIDPFVPVSLAGDPNRLRQILINLLGNSIKFTHQGRLDVHVTSDPEQNQPGHLRFAVSDTGIGIPPDKIGQIFESFAQADTSTTRQYGGTGLGLTISRQLVELMGGRIWVESQVGVGSTFFFTAVFQVREHPVAAADLQETRSEAADLERTLAGLRILLADDSEDNRFLILSYLKSTHSEIDIAENGQVAVAKFRAGRYDLVLMDVEMPVMDGYTATRAIRQFERDTGAGAVPVLALTAHAVSDVAAKTLEAGFTTHLTKPIRKVTLLEGLARHVPAGRRAFAARAAPAVPAESTVVREPDPRRIRVRVEQGMEDVVPAYLDKRRADVVSYRNALASGDFETIRMLGHKMKGTGAGYGFDMLTSMGAGIEKAAKDRDATAIEKAVSEFAQFLDSVALEYIQ